jgi:putative aldouronate transport system permease protein
MLGDMVVYGFLSLLFIVTFLPFWQIIVLSFNDGHDSLRGGVMLWPRKLTLESYAAVLRDPAILASMKITILRTLIGVPSSVLCMAMLAYPLSKEDLFARRQINLFFIFTMYFSGGLVSQYMVMKSLGLIDRFGVFIFPSLVVVFWMILIRTYMQDLPRELEESARIDGANDLQIFAKIVLPLCKPVLATVVLFTAIYHWNAWYDSYVFTYKTELKTLQAVLVKILNQYQTKEMLAAVQVAEETGRTQATSESLRMTVTVFASMPIILLYPFLQKHLLKGMMLGAIKA